MNGPDAGNEVVCGMQPQAYLAQTWIGQSLAEREYLKIVCRRDRDLPTPAVEEAFGEP
jgi:hypothetical protein